MGDKQVMQLKASEYNYIYDDLGKDNVIMYNSRTGALSIIQELQYEQFKNFLKSGDEITDKEFLEKLLQCGYVLPIEVDEKFLLKTTLMRERYDSRQFFVTIAPTMACNFRCIYCFEQGRYGHKYMDSKTISNVIKFIEKRMENAESLHISWFGGEPLLAMPVIEEISESVIAYCNAKNKKFDASIVTNGYFYTKEIAEKLKQLRVNKVQITIDGSRDIHNSRRPLINGGCTYDVIMENLVATKGIIPINIRINVDADCVDAADDVITFLKNNSLLEHVIPYLGFVLPYGNYYQKEKCFSTEEYSNLNLKFWQENNIPLQSMYPAPRGHYCIADFCNGWVIDDIGNMYKCWNEIGIPERSVGNVNNQIQFLESTCVVK